MSMIRIYCDTCGYQPWLKTIEFKDQIKLMGFPYENRNKRIEILQTPTNPTWNQMNVKWDEMKSIWNNPPSEKFDAIAKILNNTGQNTDTDAKHLDSAYKGKCEIFLTNDINDIINNKIALEKLLGIKIFHAEKEGGLAVKYISKLITADN